MKTILVVLVLLAVGIVGLGFYQGWFRLSTDNKDHKTNVIFTVDQDRIQEDKKKAEEKLQGLGHKMKDKTSGETDEIKEKELRP